MRDLSVEGLAGFLGHHPHAKVPDVRCTHERDARPVPGNRHIPWFTRDWAPNPAFLDQALQCAHGG